MTFISVLDDLSVLPDITPRRKALFRKLVGNRVIDILWHMPYTINDRRRRASLSECESGTYCTLIVEVSFHVPSHALKKPAKVVCTDGHDKLELLYFNTSKHYLTRIAPSGMKIVVSGKIEFDLKQGIWQMIHPDHVGGLETLNHWVGVEAVYGLTAGLTQSMVRTSIHKALSYLPKLPEWHSSSIKEQFKFPSFNQCLHMIHSPMTVKDLNIFHPARMRLIFDEFLAQQLSLHLTRKCHVKVRSAMLKHKRRLLDALIKNLPFELTDSQKEVYNTIEQDLAGNVPMLRLLQGDVGSGKTVVAVMAMLQAVEAGYQAAILAPTEILARQHYLSIKKYVASLGVKVEILTSREKGKARSKIVEDLEEAKIDILVGTHAIIQESVKFSKLAFVVIDEQHRFGVEQRLALSQKGRNPHILTMTATPIPRTLMMANYGEMDVSFLKEKPKGRQEVQTKIVSINRIDEIIKGVEKFTQTDQRVFWVCPLVEESENLDIAAANQRYEHLAKIFPGRVGLVHGKMKSIDKDIVMHRFSTGEIDILIATTVVEVGVDVPDATLMIIEHAERFGLQQLHQLRGRVGRGTKQSTCILLYGNNLGNVAKKRLEIIRESNDGYFIAEEDLKNRGSGEILGTRQAGFPKFRFIRFDSDDPREKRLTQELLNLANEKARDILESNPMLKGAEGEALHFLLKLFEKNDVMKYRRTA